MSATLLLCSNQESINKTLEMDFAINFINNPDLYLINREGESIKIKEIREIGEKIIYPPSREKLKTFVFYNFEKTTIPAQNAFLKSLEEHPSYVQFILQCNTLNGVLATIQSRCIIKKIVNKVINENNDSDTDLENTTQLNKIWATISIGSYAEIIELCSQYKDRSEATQLIRNLIIFVHNKNQLNPTQSLTNSLTDLSLCLSQLEQNSNVLLTLENHFFSIKSRF